MDRRDKISRCQDLLDRYRNLRKEVSGNSLSRVRRNYTLHEMRSIASELKERLRRMKIEKYLEEQDDEIDINLIN
jgi:hypothetical protein